MNMLLAAILMLLPGCTAAIAAQAPPSSAPATAPGKRELRISNAVPFARLRAESNGLDLSSRVPTTSRTLLFGQLDVYDPDGEVVSTEPVIAFKDRAGATQVLRLADARLHDAAWMFVASGPKSGEIWGVLDASLDALQSNILLVHSSDDGATFTLTAVRKPDRRAEYDSFCLDSSGRGRLSVFLAGDARRHLEQGYYNYFTTDGGATWSSPQHEPDALNKAEDATDDDQDNSTSAPTQRA